MGRDQTAGPPVLVRRSAEDWRRLVGEFEASGETMKAWCAGGVFAEDAFELEMPAQRGRAGAGVCGGAGIPPPAP